MFKQNVEYTTKKRFYKKDSKDTNYNRWQKVKQSAIVLY